MLISFFQIIFILFFVIPLSLCMGQKDTHLMSGGLSISAATHPLHCTAQTQLSQPHIASLLLSG